MINVKYSDTISITINLYYIYLVRIAALVLAKMKLARSLNSEYFLNGYRLSFKHTLLLSKDKY
ncbi:hypothetical protein GCM10011501_15910 [Thalassotalea profundi]|uniref:Uncharacterized protein n=1 Tax=Thalassotalea profundi TaxID=2036687 RepID=A0ABQ3IKQ0_9GAMM|nr:hypothetical protein GCM10011501_15910 [Thalassotalea profundi]